MWGQLSPLSSRGLDTPPDEQRQVGQGCAEKWGVSQRAQGAEMEALLHVGHEHGTVMEGQVGAGAGGCKASPLPPGLPARVVGEDEQSGEGSSCSSDLHFPSPFSRPRSEFRVCILATVPLTSWQDSAQPLPGPCRSS